MIDFFGEAKGIVEAIRRDRRYLHENAESGMHLPGTTQYVMARLREMGLEPEEICPSGVTACIKGDKPGKTFLLRADMDALPMQEETGLPFSSKTKAAHQCGHDFHAAMLLGAAGLLLRRQKDLAGTVKFMFQPGEEVFLGAKAMIDAGIMENPRVDAAMAVHVSVEEPAGAVYYAPGNSFASCHAFRVTITGKGCHGAMPHTGVDPINVGFHIYSAFQGLVARECPPREAVALTLGQFVAGTAANIIPETAALSGTLRTYDSELRDRLCARLPEIVRQCAQMFGASAEYEVLSDVPPTYNNPKLLQELLGYIRELDYPFREKGDQVLTGSEDFSLIAERVPSIMLFLPSKTEGNAYSLHNPKANINEDILPIGTAILSQCAFRWLLNNQQ